MSEVGECCEAMKLVLRRENPRDRTGITKGYSMSKTRLVHVMRQGKKAEEPKTWTATFLVLSYCPFCGLKLGGGA